MESGKLRLQWLKSCAQGHSEGKGRETLTAHKAGPGKGQTACVPPGSGLSTSWFWPLHCSLRPMNGDRPGGACRATAPPSGSLGSGCPLQPTGHAAHLPARLCSSWWLQGVVLRETPSRLRQHTWRWRACAASYSAALWAAARQAPLSMGKILQWVAVSSSR